MGRPGVLLAVVLVACAALIFAVMLWPEAHPKESVEEQTEPEVRIAPSRSGAPPKPSAMLKGLRDRASPDGGPANVDPQLRVIATLGWGSGKSQLGRARPHQGNPEAPMSVGFDRAGNALVLDQVNGRLVKLDEHGKPAGDVPLTLQNPQDLVVAKNGNTLVMDRLTDKAVAVIGPDGKQVGQLELGGRGIEDPGVLTGIFTDGDDVYVEREHGDLIRLGDTKGAADPDRPEVPGRPTRDGKSYVSANISDGARGRVAVTLIDRVSREHRFTREVPFGMPVLTLLLLDTDQSGLIYLAALGERVPGGVSGEAVATVDLLCLDPLDGRALGRAELPANTSADETFREMTVLDSGGVLYLYRTEQHAELRRVDCR